MGVVQVLLRACCWKVQAEIIVMFCITVIYYISEIPIEKQFLVALAALYLPLSPCRLIDSLCWIQSLPDKTRQNLPDLPTWRCTNSAATICVEIHTGLCLEWGYLSSWKGGFWGNYWKFQFDRQTGEAVLSWINILQKSKKDGPLSLLGPTSHICMTSKSAICTLAISWKGIPNWGRSFNLTSPFRHCKSSSDNNCQVLSLETMKSPIPGNIESKTYLDFYSFIYPVHLWTRQKRGVGEQNYDTVLSCK